MKHTMFTEDIQKIIAMHVINFRSHYAVFLFHLNLRLALLQRNI